MNFAPNHYKFQSCCFQKPESNLHESPYGYLKVLHPLFVFIKEKVLRNIEMLCDMPYQSVQTLAIVGPVSEASKVRQ